MKIIDGKNLSEKLNQDLIKKIKLFREKTSYTPTLVVILIGDNPASQVYVRNKERKANEVGIRSIVKKLNNNVKEEELLKTIEDYNNEKQIDGILVQLPLPNHINASKIIDKISIEKDVDGFNSKNIGLLALGRPNVVPCTPLGCLKMLENISPIEGKNIVIIGRSNIVGKPLSYLLTNKNATVTIAHSKTTDLPGLCKKNDIIISAIGKPKIVNRNWIKKGSIIIDVGINIIARSDGSKYIVGDVDYEDVIDTVKAISPVPGGVGPMTIHCLLLNTHSLATKRRNIVL